MEHEAALTLDRRAVVQRIGLLIGAAALPAEALAAAPKGAGAKRRLTLTPAQFALLGAVADTIVPATDTPGAVAARVPSRIDALLGAWASPTTRAEVIAALARINAAAMKAKQRPFTALSAADRTAVLKPHDATALKNVPPPPGAPRLTFFVPATYVADMGYYRIKSLVLDLYYFSAAANGRELTYEHVPGSWVPSLKLTPQIRPFLGTGPF